MSSILLASHKRKAKSFGRQTALDHILDGATEPREGILSGEWADGLTPYDIATHVGFPHESESGMDPDDYSDLLADLADVFEAAYENTFTVVEECEHVFKVRGRAQSWGVSDKARCVKCGVHILSGSTLI